MKKVFLILAIFSVINFSAFAQTKTTVRPKTDTLKTKKHKTQPRSNIVKGRRERMRLQQQQIKRHKKQLKEVDSVQKELNKELHKSGQ